VEYIPLHHKTHKFVKRDTINVGAVYGVLKEALNVGEDKAIMHYND
jgi:hypothetical protein